MSDDESDEIVSDEESEESPVRRVVPARTTRGKRFRRMERDELEKDSQFWGHDTWVDDVDDEWSTEDEANYKDVFESDFGDDSSEASDNGEDNEAEVVEKSKAKKSHKNVYIDPRAKKKSKRGDGPPKPIKRARVDWAKRFGNRSKEPTQLQHFVAATKTEQLNLNSLNQQEEQENWKKLMREQQAPTQWSGSMELLISWQSDRLIEAEEERKRINNPSYQPPDSEEVTSRDVLFFVNFNDPPLSSIPKDIYNQHKPKLPSQPRCAVTGQRARYFDPLCAEFYCDATSFKSLRQKLHSTQHASLRRRLAAVSRDIDTLCDANEDDDKPMT